MKIKIKQKKIETRHHSKDLTIIIMTNTSK